VVGLYFGRCWDITSIPSKSLSISLVNTLSFLIILSHDGSVTIDVFLNGDRV
jgi:hypothetical protein